MTSYPTRKPCSYTPLLECQTAFRCNKISQTSGLGSSLKWEKEVSVEDIEVGLIRTDAAYVPREINRVNS
jgi:hypothetical protein